MWLPLGHWNPTLKNIHPSKGNENSMVDNFIYQTHFLLFRGPPYKHPLLNFIWLLLLAIETKQTITAFSTLVELYKPSLQRYFIINLKIKVISHWYFLIGILGTLSTSIKLGNISLVYLSLKGHEECFPDSLIHWWTPWMSQMMMKINQILLPMLSAWIRKIWTNNLSFCSKLT